MNFFKLMTLPRACARACACARPFPISEFFEPCFFVLVHITLIVEKMETLLKNKIVDQYFIGKGRAQAEAQARVLVSKEVYYLAPTLCDLCSKTIKIYHRASREI